LPVRASGAATKAPHPQREIAVIRTASAIVDGLEAALAEYSRVDPSAPLRPFPPERTTMWLVSKRVGNVKNNDAGLAEAALAQPIGR
jgi:hypothetical protein